MRARLRGDEAAIKAYSIAVDVFGRPQSFDPQTDPIVRVQARRLRATLEEYYAGEGADSPVRITLPVGRYVPEFLFGEDRRQESVVEAPSSAAIPPTMPPAPAGRYRFVRLGVVLVAAVAVVVVLLQILAPRPGRLAVPQVPQVGISEFTSISAAGGEPISVAGLALELVTDLQLFDDITPRYLQAAAVDDGSLPEYQLTGVARQEGALVQVTASLKRRGSDRALWTQTLAVPAAELVQDIDDLSQQFAEQLGSHRGPLHAAAMRWLNDTAELGGQESPYLCSLLFTRYRDSGAVADVARARDCVRRLAGRDQGASTLAMRGALQLEDTLASQPLRLDPEPIAAVARDLTRAVDLGQTSSFVWQEYARYLESVGRPGEAEAAYLSALQLNPANTDARAMYTRMLAVRGGSPRGAEMATVLLTHALLPPPWYHAAPAVNALRAEDDAEALRHAEHLVSGDAELASVIATVAALRSNNQDVLDRHFAQMLDVTRFRRFGILPVLRQRIPDSKLVAEIATQLKSAGVADVALNGGF